jgi:riboflavin-specific deaminase-like protein
LLSLICGKVPERPEVTLHFAQTLDGHIDRPADPERAVISNAEGFIDAHRARASHDAVLVGIGTVLRDNPKLRVSRVPGKSPHRVVLDSRLRTPSSAKILERVADERVLIVGSRNHDAEASLCALEARGAEVMLVEPETGGGVKLSQALALLKAQGVKRLLVEGGAQIIASFLAAKIVDHVQVEVAPRFLGASGLHALGGLTQGVQLSQVAIEVFGDHVLISGTPIFA